MKTIWRVISWVGENGGNGAGIRKHNWKQNRQVDIKNSIGIGEAKELACTAHGHELRARELLEERGVPVGGGQRGKVWDNCNSIINKIYFKKKKIGCQDRAGNHSCMSWSCDHPLSSCSRE